MPLTNLLLSILQYKEVKFRARIRVWDMIVEFTLERRSITDPCPTWQANTGTEYRNASCLFTVDWMATSPGPIEEPPIEGSVYAHP